MSSGLTVRSPEHEQSALSCASVGLASSGLSDLSSDTYRRLLFRPVHGLNLDGRFETTASLIASDRSRSSGLSAQPCESSEDDAGSSPSLHHHGHSVLLAAPVSAHDPLLYATQTLGLFTTIVAAAGILLPHWFAISSTDFKQEFFLLSSETCADDTTDTNYLSSRMYVCHTTSGGRRLGRWVLAVQVLSCSGVTLCVVSLVLQLTNLCLHSRLTWLHSLSLYTMATASVTVLVAGHLAHHQAVWHDPIHLNPGTDLQVLPMGSGLLLLAAVGCAWSCVMLHVSSHGRGPLSLNTQFLYTFIHSSATPALLAGQPQTLGTLEEGLEESDLKQLRRVSTQSTPV